MACRINSPILRYPSDQQLFAAVHYRQHLPTSNLNFSLSSTFNPKKKPQISYNNSSRRCSVLSMSAQTTSEQRPVTENRMLFRLRYGKDSSGFGWNVDNHVLEAYKYVWIPCLKVHQKESKVIEQDISKLFGSLCYIWQG